MSTYTATPKDIEHRWYIVDADGMVLGRLAAEIVRVLRGKHKPMYTRHTASLRRPTACVIELSAITSSRWSGR